MASLTISIIVSADPTENVHSQIKANSADVWEVGPMLRRAIVDLQAELEALPASHWPAAESSPK